MRVLGTWERVYFGPPWMLSLDQSRGCVCVARGGWIECQVLGFLLGLREGAIGTECGVVAQFCLGSSLKASRTASGTMASEIMPGQAMMPGRSRLGG